MKPADRPPDLAPLRESAAVHDDPVAALLLKTIDPKPLGPVELARVRSRLRRRGGQRRRPGTGQLASLLVALLMGAGVAFGGWGVLQATRPARPSLPVSSQSKAHSAPPRRGGAVTPRPSPHAAEPPITSLGTKPIASEQPRHRSQAEARAQQAPIGEPRQTRAANTPNQLSLESAALARALVELRRERNPRAALAALDEYALEFPNGALFLEAQVARVDALLALGNKGAVLAVLSGLPLDHVGRGMELRLIRAELTAEHDCGKALADLDSLVQTAPAGVHERALHARAACFIRLGEKSRAAADLRTYLATYPHGRFTAETRAHLRRLGEL